jgi:DNA-binding transcriptional MocR family regulator
MPYHLTWKPELEDAPRPLVDRLLAALERDIRAGVLPPGLRLPPQRELAWFLGISLGTVTKAYAEAERRGLTQATVGRGTFVAAPTPDAAFRFSPRGQPSGVNLAQNVRPVLSGGQALNQALGKLRRRDLSSMLVYSPSAGEDDHRRAMADWLARTTPLKPDWRNLAVTAGGQQAVALALGSLASSGDAILTEAGTYYGLRTLAEHAGYRLKGLQLDQEGLVPDALDRAAAATGARVLYITPTLHNPTGRTMSLKRREEIVRVARARDLWIVEDDVYALYAGKTVTPIAALAPERTLYVSSLSKSLSAGLRVGILLTPGGEHLERVLRALRATAYSAPALGPAVGAQWIEDGTADATGRRGAGRNGAARAPGDGPVRGRGRGAVVRLQPARLAADGRARRRTGGGPRASGRGRGDAAERADRRLARPLRPARVPGRRGGRGGVGAGAPDRRRGRGRRAGSPGAGDDVSMGCVIA